MRVTCPTLTCENFGIDVEVEEGPAVVCGLCGVALAEPDPDYGDPPAPDPMADLLARLEALEDLVTAP